MMGIAFVPVPSYTGSHDGGGAILSETGQLYLLLVLCAVLGLIVVGETVAWAHRRWKGRKASR